MEHFGTQCRQQLAMFCLAWIAYASTYLLRKPIGVIKVDMQRELAFSKSTLGWLDSAFLLPYAVMQILLGPIGDKYGAQLTFASALVISSLSMVTFGYWSSPYVFAVLLFVSGSAQSQCWPNMTKLLMSWFSDNVRSTMFGFLGTSIFAGGIMATALAVYLQVNFGWRSTCFCPSVIVFMVAMMVLVFFHSSNASSALRLVDGKTCRMSTTSAEMLSIWEIWKIPLVKEAAVGMFCLKVVRYALYMWLPMYLLQQLSYSKHAAGLLSTLFEVGGVAGTAVIGMVVDRLFQGRDMMATSVSMIFSAVFLILFTWTGKWGPVFNVISLFLVGAFNAGPDAILGGSMPVEIAKRSGRNVMGATVGLVNGFGSLGSCVEGPLVGLLTTLYGWSAVFLTMSALSVIGATVVFRAASVSASRIQQQPSPHIEVVV